MYSVKKTIEIEKRLISQKRSHQLEPPTIQQILANTPTKEI